MPLVLQLLLLDSCINLSPNSHLKRLGHALLVITNRVWTMNLGSAISSAVALLRSLLHLVMLLQKRFQLHLFLMQFNFKLLFLFFDILLLVVRPPFIKENFININLVIETLQLLSEHAMFWSFHRNIYSMPHIFRKCPILCIFMLTVGKCIILLFWAGFMRSKYSLFRKLNGGVNFDKGW